MAELSDYFVLDEGDNLSDHFPIGMTLSTELSSNVQTPSPTTHTVSSLKWDKLTDIHKQRYESVLHHLTETIPKPESAMRCTQKCKCDDLGCHDALQSEYNAIIRCLKTADASLPRQKKGIEKQWWTEELTELKNKSIEIHSLWINHNQGRPWQGWTHDERIRVRAAYKRAIRAAQRAWA